MLTKIVFVGEVDLKLKVYIYNNVINDLSSYITKYAPLETGGLLFGRMNPSWVSIHKLCSAGLKAERTSSKIKFDNSYLEKVTKENLKNDFYIVGTWHSHPSSGVCYPSVQDIKTMKLLKNYYSTNLYPIFCIALIKNNQLEYDFFTLDDNFNIIKLEYNIKNNRVNNGGFSNE